MTYTLLKHIHLLCVVLTITSFTVRSFWMLNAPEKLIRKWVKVAPHVIDTCLLGSAIGMLILAWNPLEQPWIQAKIGGLLVYIVLGTMALKRGKTKSIRVSAMIGAYLAVFYIVGVALSKNPLAPYLMS